MDGWDLVEGGWLREAGVLNMSWKQNGFISDLSSVWILKMLFHGVRH